MIPFKYSYLKYLIMERIKLVVCYSGSGVKSIRVLSTIFIWLAVIGFILILAGLGYTGDHEEETGHILLIMGAVFLLQGGVFALILRGLAIIAETTLIKKSIIQTEYEIVEPATQQNTEVKDEETIENNKTDVSNDFRSSK